MDHRIELKYTPHGSRAWLFYKGEQLSRRPSAQPLYDAARWLQAQGHSLEADTLTTWHEGKPRMHAPIGWAAGRMIVERHAGGLRLAKYQADIETLLGRQTVDDEA